MCRGSYSYLRIEVVSEIAQLGAVDRIVPPSVEER